MTLNPAQRNALSITLMQLEQAVAETEGLLNGQRSSAHIRSGASLMRYRDLVSRLRCLYCEFVRPAGGSHEIWRNPSQNRLTAIPHHTREISQKTLDCVP
jgi:predicted RNA binding protein YcfA (HicA-like mRNA interferase family)